MGASGSSLAVRDTALARAHHARIRWPARIASCESSTTLFSHAPNAHPLTTHARAPLPIPQEKQLFQLKLSTKQMARMAKTCEKQEADAKNKVKKSIEKGDVVSARIHAQNAIRIKNTATNYLRLSSRIDACASRVESAIKMQQVTKQMGQVTKGMSKVLDSMDVDQISKVMDQFEGEPSTAPHALRCMLEQGSRCARPCVHSPIRGHGRALLLH